MNTYYPSKVLTIPNATPDNKDAAQYMFYKGRKQYNLCGEFCVAYCMQDEAYTNDIDDFLNYWQAKDLKWYQTLFNNGLARTTGIYDLNKMLAAYSVAAVDMIILHSSLGMYADYLAEHQIIIGVQIDNIGYLVGKGIPHWVVIDKINIIDQFHAFVDVYNPYTNAIEPYSWRELMTSSGSYKQGLIIPRLQL